MQPESTERALKRVREFCERILRFEGKPSDEAIETCEEVLNIIQNELNKE